ncbi:MAG TPA: exodeoxyribonuclease VII large subunit [Clostridiaceae bacterium]|jgi:exodeoxyribonuclease VII large subunit|nr:exodeoxyribonuclease VII large subunit [Clostridiaceae bacterium]
MQRIYSVSEINSYIKNILAKDLLLSNIWVKGEISNYKAHYSGHMYFTIKDENSLLKCVMFRSRNSNLGFSPENGMKVIIRGYLSVFERDGQYQLYAEEMVPDGMGNLYMAFEQLKKRLESEGLFDSRFKKKIPYLPKSIGVVTSSTGAVIRDIINILSRRFHNFELKIFPVAVQGSLAARQIANAVRKFNELGCVDVIIVARGGGSLEELWAFNEEIVARSIFESKIPVISAVGHETDYTISDFVADLRAPTPSAAAELVLPEKLMLKQKINSLVNRLNNAVLKQTDLDRKKLDKLKNSRVFRQPYDRIYQERMRLDMLDKYMHKALLLNKEKISSVLGTLIGRLNALSPLSVLARGYSIVRHSDSGRIIMSAKGVQKGESLEISVADGKINCTVENTELIPGNLDGECSDTTVPVKKSSS